MQLAHHHAAALREATDDAHKQAWGQYFTPEPLARFAAALVDLDGLGARVRILDPGAGTGILGLCLAERLLRDDPARKVHLTAFEHEPDAAARLRVILERAHAELGPRASVEPIVGDFLTSAARHLEPFDLVIANPPYFKLSPTDARGGDAPNAYARFMDVAAALLRPGGRLCFIIPRSFASGSYFRRFRARFHAVMQLECVHMFESRRAAFRADDVLQETIVVVYAKRAPLVVDTVQISSSRGLADIERAQPFRRARSEVVQPDDDALVLPSSPDQAELAASLRSWPDTLHSLGLRVSTGPVVPFRASEHLRTRASHATVPMLWMQHVRTNAITWPLGASFRKQEHIRSDAGTKLLVPNRTCVVVRRFSGKEDARRLIAAALVPGDLEADSLGLENHLNCIHGDALTPAGARGLAAWLNSPELDTYIRMVSGNTQVSAAELRSLPVPAMAELERLATSR